MKILLIGNYGATNIGDEAILEMILKSHPDHHFTVFSADPHVTRQRYGVEAAPLFPCGIRSFFKYGFRKPLKALRCVGAVVLGGGGLFQDDRLYACFIWAWQICWVKYFKKPLFIYATGVGPLRTWIGRKLTRYVYKYAAQITVRDENSKQVLTNLGIEKEKIFVTNDPAFLWKAETGCKERTKNLYMISLRPLGNEKDQKILDNMTKFFKWLHESKKVNFIFAVMQRIKESDDTMANYFKGHLDEQIFYPRSLGELMGRMAECEMAIGMRYHFAIAAFLTGTPCIGISYSPKVSSLFEKAHLAQISAENLTPEHLQHVWEKVMKNRKEVIATEKEISDESMIQAGRNIDLLENFLENI